VSVDRNVFETIYFPAFDGSGINILTDGVRLVLHSRNTWPFISHRGMWFESQGWDCQMACLDLSVNVVKIMLLVDRLPDLADMGVAFTRMAKLIFDDLKSKGFDENDNELSDWMESEHGWTDEDNPYDWLGFFIEEEAGMGCLGSLWETPQYLHVQVRALGFDPSYGVTRITNVWNLVDTLDNWRKVEVRNLDFEQFAKRLIAQAKTQSKVVEHMDAATCFRMHPLTT
jgi:hypothetical protein